MIRGVLQARTASRRLPGKVLADVSGRPMILRQVERLRRARLLDELVVATSTDPSDDTLATICAAAGLAVHRGDVDDVLARFVGAARGAAHVARLTADCPLADPVVIDQVVAAHVSQENDYTSNTLERTFPDGLDVEVIRTDTLLAAARDARLRSEREHVTPFFYTHPERFRLGNVAGPRDLSALRWTVDEPEDLALVREVYAALLPSRAAFTTDDVLALLAARPDLARWNAHVPLNAGYLRSLAEDAAVEPS